MDQEFWQTYFLEESKKDPNYEAIPKILQYGCVDEYLADLGFPGQDLPLDELKNYDYGSWLFLHAIDQAETQTALDSLIEQGIVESYYDEEQNDIIYRLPKTQ